jgi:hypothetical protein
MRKTHYNRGIITLVYILFIAVIATFVLAIGSSRILLAIARSRSAFDTLVSSYSAESEVSDILYKFSHNYLTDSNFTQTKDVGDTHYTINSSDTGGTRTISVTAQRGFSTSKIQAIETGTGSASDVEILMALDCTSSMDQLANPANPGGPSRFIAQRDAAISFIDKISSLSSSNAVNFSVGIVTYGVDSKFLIEPTKKLDLVKAAVLAGFSSTKLTSSACNGIIDSTSVGTGFVASQEYFKTHTPSNPNTKRIELIITDGVSNSRIPYAPCVPIPTQYSTDRHPNPATAGFCPAYPINSNNENYCLTHPHGWNCYREDEYGNYKSAPAPDYYWEEAYYSCQPEGLEFLKCALGDTTTAIPGQNRNGGG